MEEHGICYHVNTYLGLCLLLKGGNTWFSHAEECAEIIKGHI
jgi:hypothetical protein